MSESKSYKLIEIPPPKWVKSKIGWTSEAAICPQYPNALCVVWTPNLMNTIRSNKYEYYAVNDDLTKFTHSKEVVDCAGVYKGNFINIFPNLRRISINYGLWSMMPNAKNIDDVNKMLGAFYDIKDMVDESKYGRIEWKIKEQLAKIADCKAKIEELQNSKNHIYEKAANALNKLEENGLDIGDDPESSPIYKKYFTLHNESLKEDIDDSCSVANTTWKPPIDFSTIEDDGIVQMNSIWDKITDFMSDIT